MTRDSGRRQRRSRGETTTASTSASASKGTLRRFARTPAVEPLEDRRLLSHFFSGPTPIRPVQGPGGVYTLTMTGPGVEEVKHLRGGAIAISVFGTTAASSLDISLTQPRLHFPAAPLSIASIRVASGALGGITGGAASLLGPITPLVGPVNSLLFANLGPNARIDVAGALGNLTLGSVNLGPNGHVLINGDLGQTLTVAGPLTLDGGQFVITHDLSGSLNVGGMSLTRGGEFFVGHDVTGSAKITGDLTVNTNGQLDIGNNVGGLAITQSANLDSGGHVAIGGDVTGPITVGADMSLANKAQFIVGRDVTGGVTVTGNMALASNATFVVGRTLDALTVNGNILVASGASISTGGDLTKLTVNGVFIGQGSPTVADLNVGLNLGALNVLGGGAGEGAIESANINAGKNILGLNVPHGIFDSIITAGVLIDGGTPGAGGNVGADGADAVVNSRILAGVEINHLTLGGNVRSTFAVNPQSPGYPTRIVAGEDRFGNFTSGGNIDNFQITGALIDSVLAASVAPYGDSGTLPTSGYGPPPTVGPPPGDFGNNTYDAPAGTIAGGTVGAPILYPNYSEINYVNETPTGVAYNTALDPTIDDTILPGSINASFASPPLPATSSATITSLSGSNSVNTVQTTAPAAALSNPDAKLPLPTTSTVLGGVISTTHGDEADFAGIFAADTRGVFVGVLPS
jgi:hypothetical protein